MDGSSSNNRRRKRNGYLEQYPPPSPLPHNSMLSRVHSHDLNGHHPSNTSSQVRLEIDVNGGQPHGLEDATLVNNDVNLHKHSIRLNLDPNNPNHHLISFTYDSDCDGRIRIIYLAKEQQNCRFTSIFPHASEPIAFPFQRGLDQKFCQPSGTGIDLGLFELYDLSNPSLGGDVFPLVVCAETDSLVEDAPPNMQITQAVLDKRNDGTYRVKAVKEIVRIDQVRFEAIEMYGTGDTKLSDFNCNDPGNDCVICLIEPRRTVVLPCLHRCMCRECAKAFLVRSNKCPICHKSIGLVIIEILR